MATGTPARLAGRARQDLQLNKDPHERSSHRLHRAHRSCQELERRIQHDLRADPGRPFDPPCRRACRHRSGRSRGLHPWRLPVRRRYGRQRRACRGTARRPAGDHGWRHGQPFLLQRPANHCDGSATHHGRRGRCVRRRRRGVDLLRAERNQPAHARRPRHARAETRDLLVDAADRRAGGQALRDFQTGPGRIRRAQPVACRSRPDGGTVQRRDRADDHRDGRGPPGRLAGPA